MNVAGTDYNIAIPFAYISVGFCRPRRSHYYAPYWGGALPVTSQQDWEDLAACESTVDSFSKKNTARTKRIKREFAAIWTAAYETRWFQLSCADLALLKLRSEHVTLPNKAQCCIIFTE